LGLRKIIFHFKQKELCQQVQVQLNDSRQEIQVLILDNFIPSLETIKSRLIPGASCSKLV
jgi:hypothetical protein